MPQRMTIQGVAFDFEKSFTSGKERVLHEGRELSSAAGGVKARAKGKRTHAFELEGKQYVIEVRDTNIGLKFAATVDGQAQPVEMAKPAFSPAAWMVAFVVVPILFVGYTIFSHATSDNPDSGWATGGFIGSIIGALVWVGGGLYVLHRQRGK